MKKVIFILFLTSLYTFTAQAGAPKKFLKLYQKGKTLYNKINYKDAIPYFEQAEAEAIKSNVKDTVYGNLLNEMAESYRGLNNADKADKYYQLALTKKEELSGKESPTYLKALADYSRFLYKSRRFEQAEVHSLAALNLFEKLNLKSSSTYHETLTNHGSILMQKGLYIQAESYLYEAAMAVKEKKGTENIAYFSALNNLSVIYSVLTNYNKAFNTYAEIIATRNKIPVVKAQEYAIIFTNRGTLYFNLNKFAEAELDWEEAALIYRSIEENNPYYATLQNNLGVLYKKTFQYDKAEEAFKNALVIREKNPGKQSAEYATSLVNLASLYNLKGDYEKAASALSEAQSIRELLFGYMHPDYIATQNEWGTHFLLQGKTIEAAPFFINAVNTSMFFIDKNFPGMSEKEKTGFVNNHGIYFENFYTYNTIVAAKTKTPSNDEKNLFRNWYNVRLATKGLVLSSIQKTRQGILNSGDEKLITDFNNWEDQKNKIAHYYNLTIAERTQKGIDLVKLEAEAEQKEKTLSLKSEAFKKITAPSKVQWQDVQKSLQKGEAAVEIIRVVSNSDTVYAALIITTEMDYPQPVLMKNGKELEKKYFRYYQNCIRFSITDELSYLQYWKPIADKLASLGKFSKVYLSLDGIYLQINPATFFNPATRKYLNDEIEFHLLSTTKELVENSGKTFNKKKALLIGNPDFRLNEGKEENSSPVEDLTRSYNGTLFSDLPGTDVELKKINAILKGSGWTTEYYSREQANEEHIKPVSNPSVLHIATHGFFMSSNVNNTSTAMLNSGVALAGIHAKSEKKKTEDGILTAYETMNLQLDSTELVVLSACETGLGEIKAGEGVYGIQRGLRVSGAKTIVMSLWKVDDNATQELMSAFYKEWISTGNKRQAFLKAQAMIKKKYVYPYYWGAFVMVGE